MPGQVRPVLTPSTRCMVGRRARWSSSMSVSKVATGSIVELASEHGASLGRAPSPASIQPSSSSTSMGDFELRSFDQLVGGDHR